MNIGFSGLTETISQECLDISSVPAYNICVARLYLSIYGGNLIFIMIETTVVIIMITSYISNHKDFYEDS